MRDGHEIIDPGEDLPLEAREALIEDLKREVWALRRALVWLHKAVDPYYPSDEYIVRSALNSAIAATQDRIDLLRRTDR